MRKQPKILLTGGPCAGKTTIIQVLGRTFGSKVAVVPEAASMLFSGGFPRWESRPCREAVQRAIYAVQLQLEAAYEARYPDRALLLDRGTLDGAAYWPEGTESFCQALGTTENAEFGRYDHVICLEFAGPSAYQAHQADNPSRTETWEQASGLNRNILELWWSHPALSVIRNQRSFSEKVNEAIRVVRAILGNPP